MKRVVLNILLFIFYAVVIVFGIVFVLTFIKDNEESKVFNNYEYEEVQGEVRNQNDEEVSPHIVQDHSEENTKKDSSSNKNVLEKTVDVFINIFNNEKEDNDNNEKTTKPTTTKVKTTTKKQVDPTKPTSSKPAEPTTTKSTTKPTTKTTTAPKSNNYKCSIDKYTKKVSDSKIDRIHYISVGGSDATLIESNGHFGLVDSSNPPYKDGTPQAIIENNKHTVNHVIDYLKKVIGCSGNECKGKLEFVIATHSHSDHIGGMAKIASVFANKNTTYYYRKYERTTNDFFENGYYNSTLANGKYDSANDWANLTYYTKGVDSMKANGACLEEVTNNNLEFAFGDMKIKLLNTEPIYDDESSCIKNGKAIAGAGKMSKKECTNNGGKMYAHGENRNSIIQLITYKNSKVLLAADIEYSDELRLINNNSIKSLLSNVDAIKFGHHGNIGSTHINFIKVVKPKYGIISRGSISKTSNILSMRYSQNNYGTKIYALGNSAESVVQSFNDDGTYKWLNVKSIDSKKNLSTSNISDVTVSFKDISTSGKWHQIKMNDSKEWFYFDSDELIKTKGWFKYNNKWYYINTNGRASKGWDYLDYNGVKSWYYFKDDCAMATGWVKVNNAWYYLSSSGAMVTGWKKINYNGNDEWFYFNDNGVMKTGWIKVSGEWYYLNSKGVMQTGFVNYEGKTYYLESSGKMVHDKCITINGQNCCFNSSGAKTN